MSTDFKLQISEWARRPMPLPSGSGLDDAEQQGEPLHMPGLVSSWPACGTWASISRLRRAGEACVQVMLAESDIFFGDLYSHRPTNMRFAEFLDEAERAQAGEPGPFLYLAQHSMADGMLELQGDILVPGCLASRRLRSTNLWMCIRGSRSDLHHDVHDNLLCVVAGSKKVTLHPPSATPYVYPLPITDESCNHSRVNFSSPDFTLHPRYRQALQERVEVTLEPGDALFIPSGWWHQVDSSGVTIAVNYWWEPAAEGAWRTRTHSFCRLRSSMGEALSDMTQQMVREVPPWQLGQQTHAQQPQPSSGDPDSALTSASPLDPTPLFHMDGVAPRAGAQTETASDTSSSGRQPSALFSREEQAAQVLTAALDPHNRTPAGSGVLSSLLAALTCCEAASVLFLLAHRKPSLIHQMFFGGAEAGETHAATAAAAGAHVTEPSGVASCAGGRGSGSARHLTPLAAYLLTSKLEELEQAESIPDFSVAPVSHEPALLCPSASVAHPKWLTSSASDAAEARSRSMSAFYAAFYGATGDPDKAFDVLLRSRKQLADAAAERVIAEVLGLQARVE